MSMRGRAVSALVVLLVVAAACSNAKKGGGAIDTGGGGAVTTYAGSDFSTHQTVSAPGVTDTEIRVGSIVSKTNPLGTDMNEFNKGLQAYLDYVDAKGGVWGRKIKLVSQRDDQTANNATEADALLSQDNVYAAFVAVELFTGAPKLAAAGIPTFGWNINAEWQGPENFFPNVAPICFNQCSPFQHVAPWMAQKVHAAKVGVLAYAVPQSASCGKGISSAFKEFGNDVGAHVAFADTSLQFGQTDYSAQVSKMKAAGVDFLVSCMDYNGDFAVAKEMVKQGIRDKVTFMHPNMYDQDFVKANARYFSGDLVVTSGVVAFEHQPQPASVKQFISYAKAHDVKILELSAQGWVAGMQFVSALKAAGPNFTWKNLVQAWNTTTWYTADGWVPPTDWSRQHGNPGDPAHAPRFECTNVVRVQPNGDFKGVWDDHGKPWVCWDGANRDQWYQPVNVRFDTDKPFTFKDAQRQG
jgi:branched-chain amino acid transport system substrate-binding protein